jgi:type IV pilus assembly protein PilY1
MSSLSTTVAGNSASYYMAGLASWAARSDIRPRSGDFVGTQTVKSFIIDVEEIKDCGYQSQYWFAAKYGSPDSYNSAGEWLSENNPWSQNVSLPSGSCSLRAPETNSAGVALWPKNLLRAGDPRSMIASVKGAIEQIKGEVGDEAALAQSSGNLDTGTGAYVYRATYNSGGWSGDVQALLIDQNGAISSVPVWSAAAGLPAASARKIFSFNDSSTTRAGIAFDPDAFSTNLSADQQALLNADQYGIADGHGADRMRYLRGDQSKEANQAGTNYGWRIRSSLLGDVINSSPVYVGRPQAGYSDANYKSFATTYASRLPVVYVGGNDGMLHGYDASYTIDSAGAPQVTTHSGTEIVGYVPASLYGKLSLLMSPNYSHRYFVDGSPVVADACVADCAAASAWKTILVGTLNAGGQGVFALDVTDPADSGGSSRFSASKVLWEFTDHDDAELGYTFSRPIIRKLNDGKWYVIFGNGFNNTQADANASANGRAYLFLLPVGGPGSGNAWVRDTNYYRIELKSPSEGVSATLPLNPPNGLSSVAGVDRDLDGMADYVYAGDRNGNLWKIDLTATTPSGWKAAFGTSDAPSPLFTTSDGAASPSPQPIATGIEVARHPNGGFLVMFGTGTWIDTTDPIGPFKTQSLYGIWDKDDGTTTVSGRGVLQQQKVLVGVDSSGNACSIGSGDCYLVYSSCQPNYSTTTMASNAVAPLCPTSIAYTNSGQQLGWYIDVPMSGERTRSSFPVIFGKNIRFTTLTPATDPCTGNTLGMEHNLSYLTGGSPEQPLFVFSGNTTGFVTVLASVFGSSGANIKVVLGGRLIEGGASDQPVTFSARPPAEIVPAMKDLPSPPTSACVGAACGAGYIPGWGFLMNLGASSQYALSCHPPQFGTGLPICAWEYKNAKFGRLNWKQILR